jgi:hypothetical protein
MTFLYKVYIDLKRSENEFFANISSSYISHIEELALTIAGREGLGIARSPQSRKIFA